MAGRLAQRSHATIIKRSIRAEIGSLVARSSPESAAGIIIEGGGILVVVVEPPSRGGRDVYRLLNDVSLDQQLESTIYCPSHGGGGGDQYRRGEDHLSHPSHPIPTFKLKSILHLSLSLSPLLLSSFPRVSCTRCCCCCMSVDCRSAGNVRCIRRRGTIAGDSGNDRLQGSLSQSTVYVSCFEVWGRIYARLAFLRRPPYM